MAKVEALEIATVAGKKLIPAEFVGPFAIHRTQGYLTAYTVTHTATGWAVTPTCLTRDDAVALAHELMGEECWEFTDPAAVKQWTSYRTDKIKRIVRSHLKQEPTNGD